MAANMTTRNSG